MNKMSEDKAELTSSAAAVEGDTNEQMQDDKALGPSESQHCADAAMRDNYKTVLGCNRLGKNDFVHQVKNDSIVSPLSLMQEVKSFIDLLKR